jgi:hypothetical protein
MSKSVSKSVQPQRFSERQFASEWGNAAKHSRGTKKVLRNRVRAKENQMLRSGKFNFDSDE